MDILILILPIHGMEGFSALVYLMFCDFHHRDPPIVTDADECYSHHLPSLTLRWCYAPVGLVLPEVGGGNKASSSPMVICGCPVLCPGADLNLKSVIRENLCPTMLSGQWVLLLEHEKPPLPRISKWHGLPLVSVAGLGDGEQRGP